MHVLGDAGLGVKPAISMVKAVNTEQVSIAIALRIFTVQGAPVATLAGPMHAINWPLTCFEASHMHVLGVLLRLCESVVAR
jgi:hypothetical protein